MNLVYGNDGSIRRLQNIFLNVFERFYTASNFHISMSPVLERQKRVEGRYPIVLNNTVFNIARKPIATSVQRVLVAHQRGFSSHTLREVLRQEWGCQETWLGRKHSLSPIPTI
jgi:hypothetical protein